VKKFAFTFRCFIFLSLTGLAWQETITPDGKKVALNPNGTWVPAVSTQSAQTPHSTTIYHLELPRPNSFDQIIYHKGYTVSYNLTYHVADWVAYELTAEETVPVVQRNNHFVPDPLLKSCSASIEDYKGSGYDRGHLAPSADMCYSYQTMVESFYLSNITPQAPGFNRGIWEKLERQVRQWAIDDKAVYIVTGTVLTKGLPTIGYDRITVPAYFYKVILDYTEPDIKGIGFIIPNQGSQEPLQHYAVTIDSVEKVTGTDFFYQLPQDQKRIIESAFSINKWNWTATRTHSSREGRSQSVQCKGITKSGARCRNMTTNSNGYCYLHQRQAGGVQQQNNTAQPSSNRRTVPVRCSAITKKGTQCTRMTYSPNGKCWQHGGD
jgi:endonuclease G